jgi:hypothetical protein
MSKKNNFLLVILGATILVAGGYYLMVNNDKTTTTDTTQTASAYENANTTHEQLDALKSENESQDFSEVESDFGAAVNAAVQ